MREDIWYRGQYRPSGPGNYRVTLNESNVWLVDRASYSTHGSLSWAAVPFDAPAAEAAVQAHKLMRDMLSKAKEDASGYFLAEQLCQWAATVAAQKVEEQGCAVTPAAAVAVAKVAHLTQMPLIHALANLQRAELIPDGPNALQAQMLIYACKKADDADLLSAARDMQTRLDCNWLDVEAIQRRPNVSRHLQLASPSLINALRRQAEVSTQLENGTLATTVWHFEAGTPAAALTEWLDDASNHPVDFQDQHGSVRVIRDWSNLKPSAEQYCDEAGWNALDSETNKAKAAVAAYNWGQDHSPSIFSNASLQREGFLQVAANIASGVRETPLHAAQAGIIEAKKRATSFFTCTRTYAHPVEEQGEVFYQLEDASTHKLTRDGIQQINDYTYEHPAVRHNTMEAMMKLDDRELVLGVTIAAPHDRLHLNCEPKAYLRIRDSQAAPVGNMPSSVTRAGLQQLAADVGLGSYKFEVTDSLTNALQQPNEYRVKAIKDVTSTSDPEIIADITSHDDVAIYEASELKRIFRERGISDTPSVEQYGDGTWSVTWRSENPEENRDYFEHGTETYHALMLLEANGQPVTPEVAEVFAKEVGVQFKNPYSHSPAKGAALNLG